MATNVREEVVKLIVDGKQVTGSYNELKKSQREIIKNLRGLEQGTEQYQKEAMKLNRVNAELNKVDSNIKKVSKTFNRQKSIWNQAKAQFAGTFAALSVAGAVQQIGVLGQRLVSFIKDLTKHRREITRLTGVTGRDLDVVSSKIQSIVDTFDKDFNEVLIASNALAKQMGITTTEALEAIQTGFANGADANGEFLDKLKEYPAQLKSAGLSAKESIAIMTMEVKTGIYSDKGIDTIKEGTLRLREMTKATREALDGIGISSTELEQKLRSGTITYFEAIQMVSDKLDDLQEQSPEVGTAIADIFGGPGEDAGLEYLRMLGEINTELTATETPTTKLAEANERLALAYQKLADDDGLITKAQIALLNFSASAINAVGNLDLVLSTMFDSFDRMSDEEVGRLLYLGMQTDSGKEVLSFFKDLNNVELPELTKNIDSYKKTVVDALVQEGEAADQASRIFDVYWQSRQKAFISDNPSEGLTGPQQIPGIVIPETDKKKTPGSSNKTTDVSAVEYMTHQIESLKAQTELTDELTESRNEYMSREAEAFAQEQANHEEKMRMMEAELYQKKALIEAEVLSGMQSVQNAENIQDYGKAIANQARSQIQAAIAKGIAEAIAAQLGTGPLGIFLAAGAGIAAQGIFNSIVPSFYFGGDTGSKSIGFGDRYGAFTGMTHEDEFVIPKMQRSDPYVAATEQYVESRKKFGAGGAATSVNANVSLDAQQFMMAAQQFSSTVAVLQKRGIPSHFSRRSFEDAQEDYNEKETARNRGAL